MFKAESPGPLIRGFYPGQEPACRRSNMEAGHLIAAEEGRTDGVQRCDKILRLILGLVDHLGLETGEKLVALQHYAEESW